MRRMKQIDRRISVAPMMDRTDDLIISCYLNSLASAEKTCLLYVSSPNKFRQVISAYRLHIRRGISRSGTNEVRSNSVPLPVVIPMALEFPRCTVVYQSGPAELIPRPAVMKEKVV